MRPRNPTEDEYKQMLANMGKVRGDGHAPTRSVARADGKRIKLGVGATSLPRGVAGSTPAPSPPLSFELIIVGQMPSGKNQVRTAWTKNKKIPGKMKPHKYPDKRFAQWRDEAVGDLVKQWRYDPITEPVRLHVTYWPGDRKTRDVPGMEDALFHVLVKARILKDDGLVRDLLWYGQPMNRKGPKVLITIARWEV